LVAGGVAAAVALSSGSSSSKPPAAPLFAAAARPVPTNDVTGNGSAKLQLRGNVATVTVNTNGLLNAVHFMHIHGGTGNCPPATAALTKNGQQFIPAAVGDRFYGPVVTSLTQHGDTSAASHVTPSLYATTGAITYTRSITLAPGVAGEIRNGLAVLVVHGIDHNGNSRYDDSLGAGVELNAPALCGPLFPSQTAAGKGRTVYVASLGREDPGPASLSLLCHLGDVADPRVGAA
jgi:Cu/Zn superoxide dismutase